MTSIELLDLGLDDVLVLEYAGKVGDVVVFLGESSELTLRGREGEGGRERERERRGEGDEERMGRGREGEGGRE